MSFTVFSVKGRTFRMDEEGGTTFELTLRSKDHPYWKLVPSVITSEDSTPALVNRIPEETLRSLHMNRLFAGAVQDAFTASLSSPIGTRRPLRLTDSPSLDGREAYRLLIEVSRALADVEQLQVRLQELLQADAANDLSVRSLLTQLPDQADPKPGSCAALADKVPWHDGQDCLPAFLPIRDRLRYVLANWSAPRLLLALAHPNPEFLALVEQPVPRESFREPEGPQPASEDNADHPSDDSKPDGGAA